MEQLERNPIYCQPYYCSSNFCLHLRHIYYTFWPILCLFNRSYLRSLEALQRCRRSISRNCRSCSFWKLFRSPCKYCRPSSRNRCTISLVLYQNRREASRWCQIGCQGHLQPRWLAYFKREQSLVPPVSSCKCIRCRHPAPH